MKKSYKPSNGQEAEAFFSAFCDRCTIEAECEIPFLTMTHSINDSEYPSEWLYAGGGVPVCTEFVLKEEVIERAEKRDYYYSGELQQEMF